MTLPYTVYKDHEVVAQFLHGIHADSFAQGLREDADKEDRPGIAPVLTVVRYDGEEVEY